MTSAFALASIGAIVLTLTAAARIPQPRPNLSAAASSWLTRSRTLRCTEPLEARSRRER